jgi:hypothetical protein
MHDKLFPDDDPELTAEEQGVAGRVLREGPRAGFGDAGFHLDRLA